MPYVLAIDIGTSAVKVTVVNENMEAVSEANVGYETFWGTGGVAEQNPEDWWKGICKAVRLIGEQAPETLLKIEAIGMSGHMMGLTAVDRDGHVLRPTMIHADTRAAAEMREIEEQQGRAHLYQLTGNVCNPSANLFKMLWLKRREPENYERAARFLQVKDYLVYRLTGNMDSTDYSEAIHGLLMDIRSKRYLSELMEEYGLDTSKLPQLHKSSDVVGRLSGDAVEILGLKEGIPVVAGGGDGSCASIGAGIRPGDIYCSLGTTAWISYNSPEPFVDEKQRVFNLISLDGESSGVFGTMQCAGRSITWAQELLKVDSLKEFDEMSGRVVPGCEGLIFLPYLEGERSPIFDARVRGMFWGISAGHRQEHFSRAVLEGVGYALRSILDVMREREDFREMRIIGGGAKSLFWKQMIADICQIDLCDISVKASMATSVGAAAAAFVGVGRYTWEQAADRISLCGKTDAREEAALLYRENYQKYLQLYPAIRQLL